MLQRSNAALAALLGLSISPATRAAGTFHYDPASPLGPDNWASLDIDNNQCGGTSNSPIAVKTSSCSKYGDYQLNGGTCTVDNLIFSLNDHGLKASYNDDCIKNTLVIPGIDATFEALQFHIHTSSEHTINGETFSAELHIVHKQTDADRYAVVGMMLDVNSVDNHETLDILLDGWDTVAEATKSACGDACPERRLFEDPVPKETKEDQHRKLVEFDPYKLVPKGATFYHYDGGLTTPPCSEVVWWNLADISVSISVKQFQRLSKAVLGYIDPNTCKMATVASPGGSTSRPVQPLGGRIVDRICPTSMQPKAPVWSYEGQNGPANWASLNIPNNQCGGTGNSPIAITTPSGACSNTRRDYTFTQGNCRFADLKFTLNDHGVKATYEGCTPNTAELPGKPGRIFEALQFHIHTSSEHTIDGHHYPAELHIVHKERDGNMFSVVGMMIDYDADEPDEAFETLLSGWRETHAITEVACAQCTRRTLNAEELNDTKRALGEVNADFNAYDLVPTDSGFFTYDGGLTTPPCTEAVYWNLASKPLSISIAQYSELADIIINYKNPANCQSASVASSAGSTSRPPQPINGRAVNFVCSS